MKSLLIVTILLSIGGCVGIHTETQKSKKSPATNVYYKNGTKHLWSQNEHPTNGSVTVESERRWCGLTLWAIVPIPLKLPVCNKYIKVSFENNVPAIRTEGWVDVGNFYGCGPGVWLGSGISNGSSPSFCIAD